MGQKGDDTQSKSNHIFYSRRGFLINDSANDKKSNPFIRQLYLKVESIFLILKLSQLGHHFSWEFPYPYLCQLFSFSSLSKAMHQLISNIFLKNCLPPKENFTFNFNNTNNTYKSRHNNKTNTLLALTPTKKLFFTTTSPLIPSARNENLCF